MARLSRKRIAALVATAIAVAVLGLALAGCQKAPEAKLEPKVKPPALKQAGTLKAGIDLSYPPFGGTDNGRQAGIDIDTAQALAGKLGLKVEIVNVKPSDAPTAIADGKVDVVFSVPYSEDALSRVSLAGSYISDGPAFFVATEGTGSVVPSMTLDTLSADKVGAQEGSPAFWTLTTELGTDGVVGFPTLRDALDALSQGQVKVVAGDAVVGAYIIRDMGKVHFAGQMEPALPLGVAVAAENSALGDPVRAALDELAADGVLETIRSKWVGSLPKLALPASLDASGSGDTSTTP